jgi:hypothetical protein
MAKRWLKKPWVRERKWRENVIYPRIFVDEIRPNFFSLALKMSTSLDLEPKNELHFVQVRAEFGISGTQDFGVGSAQVRQKVELVVGRIWNNISCGRNE